MSDVPLTDETYPRSSLFQCLTIDEMSSFGSCATSSWLLLAASKMEQNEQLI